MTLKTELNLLTLETELEPSFCEKRQKNPNQETVLGNRGLLNVLNDTKFILNDQGGPSYFLGPI